MSISNPVQPEDANKDERTGSLKEEMPSPLRVSIFSSGQDENARELKEGNS
jgi:hypothetical protein